MDYLKIARYIVAGGTAALVNLATLYILTEWLDWWYLFSSIVAFGIAFIVSFNLQKFWTFKEKSLNRLQRQFIFYLLVILSNLAINTFLLYLLVEKFSLPYLIAQIITGGLLAIFSFSIYHRIFFNPMIEIL